jgi:septal ring factor EnvC (AmiA/AmiB activator)
MEKQRKNICVYAIVLFVVAASLILLSSIFQNRITKEREEEIKSNLTTDITARLQKNMQQNIDDITDENTKLKTQVKQDKSDISSLKNQISELNKLVADKDLTETEKATLEERYKTVTSDIDEAINYYSSGRTKSARRAILSLQETIDAWNQADAETKQAASQTQQNQTTASTSPSPSPSATAK